MGKMFVVTFDFCGKAHQAAVRICGEETGTTAFTVCFSDKELNHLLPGGRFSFISSGELVPAGAHDHPVEELILSVKVAISQHLLQSAAGNNDLNSAYYDQNRNPTAKRHR